MRTATQKIEMERKEAILNPFSVMETTAERSRLGQETLLL